MQAKPIYLSALFALLLFATICAQAQPATPQQTLQQYVADLQNNPNDTVLRGKIIALAQTMNPPPAIPPSAHQDYVMAVTFVESAKDNTGYEHAIDHFKSALLAAPWWMDAYKKLAIAQKTAGHYDDAIATLNLYLLAQPADASDAQDEIYKLMALKQAATDVATQKQREEEQRAAAERQRAYEASPEGRWQALLKKIDGAKYPLQDNRNGTIGVRAIEIHDNVAEYTCIGTNCTADERGTNRSPIRDGRFSFYLKTGLDCLTDGERYRTNGERYQECVIDGSGSQITCRNSFLIPESICVFTRE